jgi:V/A-type H+-transporting ATPase subunit A
LIERTILIANTSNMPVAAREASIYTGITIAEYFRDMGYDVALMADSTSRWGEALREVSGRLEEMPGEEGYPAYLATRLSAFYERAGRVICMGAEERTGSVTVVGAVSPPGGDFSEPITQNTLRVVGTFWALDTNLAYRRHFPSINWIKSYSLYLDSIGDWYVEHVARDWRELREKAMYLLQKEVELQEIVQLVGPDALPESEKAILDVTRMIREDFLQQSAYSDSDSFCPVEKQYLMLKVIMEYYENVNVAMGRGVSLQQVQALPLKTGIGRMKEVQDTAELRAMIDDIGERMRALEVER